MTLLRALVLGILQGTTEFLPVSSSGHLVLVPWLIGWPDPGLTYNAVVHLGTFVAVMLYFWADVSLLAKSWLASLWRRRVSTSAERLAWLVLFSAVPGGLAGYLLQESFAELFGSPAAVAGLLIVTGGMLFLSERLSRRERELPALGVAEVLLIGAAQALAIAPGISRSGATISACRAVGMSRENATRFSFLMGIPLIAGAAASQILEAVRADAAAGDLPALFVGFGVATISGYISIRFLLRIVRRHSLRAFACYCWAFGALALAFAVAV